MTTKIVVWRIVSPFYPEVRASELISLSSQFVVFLFNDNLSVNITVVSRILVCCYFKWLSALGRSLYDGGIEVRILAPNKNFSIFYQIFQNLGLFCVYICHSRTCTCSNRKVTLKIVFFISSIYIN